MERESANSHLANDGQNSFSWVTRMKNYALDSLHPLTPAVAGLLIFFGIAQYMTGALLFLHLLTLQIPIPEILDFFTITSVATWIAPAFGFITDLVVVRGQRRKPLLIISAVVLTILWPIIAGVSKDTVTLALGIVSAFFNSVQNTTLNGLIVENTPENKDGRAQSRAFLIRTIASFIGAVINIILLLFTPLRIVLGISSLFYFFSIFFCVFVPERVFSTIANDRHQIHPNPSESTSSKEQHAKTTRRDSPHPVDDTVSAIQSGDIQDDHDSVGENTAPVTHSVEKKQFISLRMTPVMWGKLMFHLCTNLGFLGSFIFVFIYTAVPDASTPYFSYIASLYHFNPVILSIFNAFGLLGGIFGGWFYVRFLTQLNVRLTFVIGSTCYILGILSNLIVVLDFWSKVIHLPIYIFVPLDQFIVTFFQRIAFTPVIQLASLCSPSGIESEVFQFFSVVAFAGGTLSGFLSGLVAQLFNITFTDFSQLQLGILTVAGFRLLSTLFVFIVPSNPIVKRVVL